MNLRSMARGTYRGLNAVGGFLTAPRKPRYLYLAAFLTPFVLIALMWAVSGVIPFGHKMILAHDQWHQYYPFFLDLRTRLREGSSLFHSWTTGMGTNYLSLFAYYLASPLNLPAVLLPEGLLMPYYALTVLIRLGLAGLFCVYFLKKTFGRQEFSMVFFSTAYALCAFFMGYYWNAIWLDTVALLPLVALGTLGLLRERRYVLYVVSLALSVYCSYYIGLFTCIFVLLLFIGWHVVNWDDAAGFWTRFFRIGVFTLLALGMTAFLSIPAFLGLQSTSSAVNRFPESNAMNLVSAEPIPKSEAVELVNQGELEELFTFFDRSAPSYGEGQTLRPGWIGVHESLVTLRLGYVGSFLQSFRLPIRGLRQVLANTGTLTEPTTMEGGPNIFCGFCTLMLAMLYLFCRRIPRRERIFTVLLLLFFANSFLFRTLDYLWHGMHFPNMLPHRFSFLWSFVVIFMAFRAYTQLEHLRKWQAMALAVPTVLLVYCVASSAGELRVELATTAVAIFVLALLLFYAFRAIRKELLVLGLCLCMLAESLGCAVLGVHKIGVTDSNVYPRGKEDLAPLVETMKKREADTVDLWRAEVSLRQTLNDGTLLGYPGISVFSSAANSSVSVFLQSLGIAASAAGNRYVYQEADPFTNLLLGLKYLLDRNGVNTNPDYFRQVTQRGDALLLENRYYISLGFLVSDNALEYDASKITGHPYERLNRLFREMTGIEEELFTVFPVTEVKAVGTAELKDKTDNSFKVSGDCDSENYVEAVVVMPQEGRLCVYGKGSQLKDVSWYQNGEKLCSYSDAYGYNRCMGSFSEGQRLSLRLQCKEGKEGSELLTPAIFHDEVFRQGYEKLSANTMLPTLVSDTEIEGAIRIQEAGLLYLSIPNDPGWTLTVDGAPARITPVGDAMIAVHLEPGLHAIRLDYETPGFSLGLKISIICLAAFLLLLILALLLRFTRPPIVKVPVELADPRRSAENRDPAAPPASEPLPRKPATTMPQLDLTQSWDATAPKTPAPPVQAPTEAAPPIKPEPPAAPPAPPTSQPSAPVKAPARGSIPAPGDLMATTGVFDPLALYPDANQSEERPRSSAFQELKSLERLERLLAEEEQEDEEAPEEPEE